MPELDLEHVFTYHPATEKQRDSYVRIRTAAKALAAIISAECPECADQTAAIRKLRGCVMTANAAVALEGRLYLEDV